jgi:hypothetical protein
MPQRFIDFVDFIVCLALRHVVNLNLAQHERESEKRNNSASCLRVYSNVRKALHSNQTRLCRVNWTKAKKMLKFDKQSTHATRVQQQQQIQVFD